MKKWLLLIVVLTVSIAIIIIKLQPKPLSVWVSPVDSGMVEKTVSNTRAGTIKACRRSKLSMPMGGVVDQLLVKKGDAVKPGQLLLELWSRDHHANVNQAKAAVNAAQHAKEQICLLADRANREAEHATTLLKKGLIAADIADTQQSNAAAQNSACAANKAQVEVAKSQLDVQQAVLERFQLRAPFSGIIAEINGEIGEYVTPSPPGVLTPPAIDLIDTSCLYATAPIDEVDAADLTLGMQVNITLDAFRDRVFTGTLTRISPYVLDVEKQARTVDVDVKFDQVPNDVTLLIGYSADVSIIISHVENALRVPSEALINNNEVWIVSTTANQKTQTLHKKTLQLGIGNYRYTQVINGLSKNDLVVRSPDTEGIAEDKPAKPDIEP